MSEKQLWEALREVKAATPPSMVPQVMALQAAIETEIAALKKQPTFVQHRAQLEQEWCEVRTLATAAAKDVLAERERQKSAEGWTPEHDDEHDDGSLAQAAACYLLNAQSIPFSCGNSTIWPWAREWWKPKDRRRDLVRAGALILAEIERLDRAAAVGAP